MTEWETRKMPECALPETEEFLGDVVIYFETTGELLKDARTD